MATLGDITGDGCAEIVISAYNNSSGKGAVYIYHGSASGIGTTAATTLAGILLAYLLLPFDQVNPAVIAFALWVIAAPAIVLVAS